jgi:excisionase family DNA binding protein
MQMLSPAQVAELTGLSRAAIYRAVEEGELRASKLRGRIRVEETELAAWKERTLVRPRPRVPAYEPPTSGRASPRGSTFRQEVRTIKKQRAA